MKTEPNKFTKQNNDQIEKERIDAIYSINLGMVYCPEKKEMVGMERCKDCIFYHPERLPQCDYDNWKPGMRKGREW